MSESRPPMKNNKRLSAQERQELLLEVATELFLEKGYEGMNLDKIISRTGGSRRTIYTQFGGKDGLFKALVTKVATQALKPIPTDIESNLEDSLFSFASSLLNAIFTPLGLNVSRLAIMNEPRIPELATAYFMLGPQKATESLSSLLDVAQKRGEINCKDTKMAANQFIGMLRDNIYLEVLLQLRTAPETKEKEEMIHNAIDIFLNGIKKRD